jgi:predicted ATPase
VITEVYVDGYRSLSELEIPIKPGVNVLVGPNGGGKTNILSFFEFLSLLKERPVDEAISIHGGIGRVFSRTSEDTFRDSLNCRVRGHVTFRGRGNTPRLLYYTWEFCIKTSENFDEIYYDSQKLSIDLQKSSKTSSSNDLILGTREQEGFGFLTVQNMVITRIQPIFHSFRFLSSASYIPYRQAVHYITAYTRGTDLRKNAIVSAFPVQLHAFSSIASDISGGKIYNFVPEVCKQPEDSSRPPIIEKNGAGLASTLYHIGRPRRQFVASPFRPARVDHLSDASLRRITDYINLISGSVQGISTKKNQIDNTISVFVHIDDGAFGVDFPLAHCSDGTVKWIALITTLMTTSAGFSIEEPENFLHPNIQREFLNVVRTERDRFSRRAFTLLTTHSESLLNEASPDELILVWMDDGATKAERISNSADIVAEINRTGFGLGHYYSAGSLQGG